jgi:hypothetical protein
MKRLGLLLVFAGCATVKPGPPLYRVHLDTLAPAKVQQFEDARLAWLKALTVTGAYDAWRGAFYAVDDDAFLSLRRLKILGDLDPPENPGPPPDALAVKAYNDGSDEGLVFPHLTQVWMLDEDLSYRPATRAMVLDGSGFGRWVLDAVEPNGGEVYEKAWAVAHKALGAIAYPITHFVFDSRFGDGRMLSLWLAPSEADFDGAGPLEDALAKALGQARAEALLGQIAGARRSTESHRLRGKPAMSNP